ncbi:golgin subfamily A member 2 isoform X2 [Quercus lobata]|uniref:golgin subfamily A member 2 isoform X2 n=1 Tax=Quercus lobata TaxID=97700 RepID=UPI001247193F|nr:golgin subfamily A member 2 isoform X2 [Quercus lobata]
MEDDKKKKRSKKKKNKQSKATEGVGGAGDLDSGEPASCLDDNHGSNGQDDHVDGHVQVSDAHDGSDVQNLNVDLNGHLLNGTSVSVEAEKQQRLRREATLEETIKQLQSENDLHIKKEVSLQETVKELQNENKSLIKKEASLEETIKQLQYDNNSYIQKEAGQEMIIVQLQNEKNSLLNKEAGWEEKINQLLDEKANLSSKGAGLVEKISQLLDERASLSSKGASLEEKVKHLEREKEFWISNENSSKEMIANLNGDVAKLQAQVMEVEEFRNNLLQENQRLMEIISGLQSQIQNLESSMSSTSTSDELKKIASENKDLNSRMEAACALVDKLITENAELVEKVNELYVELDRRSPTAGLPSATVSDQMVEIAETARFDDFLLESNENLSVEGKKLESGEIVPIQVETIGGDTDNVDVEQAPLVLSSFASEEPGEIVQISLDENEIRDLGIQAANNDENTVVEFSDAPLIGAPFRLISFVAKYVSGADLIDKNCSH